MAKSLFDYIPTIIFVLVYVFSDIITATAAMIGAAIISMIVYYAIYRTYPKMMLISTLVLVILGGLTLLLNEERFIKMKPTIVYAILTLICFGSVMMHKPVVQYLFKGKIDAPMHIYASLTKRFGVFFIGMAIVNEIIWRNFSTDFWVSYKLFGGLVLTIIFIALNIRLLLPYMVEKDKNN